MPAGSDASIHPPVADGLRRTPRVIAVFGLAALGPLPGGQAWGAIDFDVDFRDVALSTGVGFDDPLRGAERRATFHTALDQINTVIDAPGAVTIRVNPSQTDGEDFLASAGTSFFPAQGVFTGGEFFQAAALGGDPFPGTPEAFVTFDFGFNWNEGLNAPARNEIDLFSVTLHEISHAMGFTSLIGADGLSRITGTNPGAFSLFDSFLVTGDGESLFDGSPGATPGRFVGSASDLTGGDLFFAGPEAVAANGGQPVPIFAPGVFSEGSSLSHITGDPAFLMNPSIAPGQQRRAYTDVELGILRDLGYTLLDPPATPTTLVGDLNRDEFVGAADLDLLLGLWNQALPGAEADLNGDGFIGAGDLDLLLGNWNASLSGLTAVAGVVPEPGGGLLLLLLAPAVLARARGSAGRGA